MQHLGPPSSGTTRGRVLFTLPFPCKVSLRAVGMPGLKVLPEDFGAKFPFSHQDRFWDPEVCYFASLN